jgi:metal-responsive CopG/Arc/MetJ family transcriptional regulator
MPRNVYRGKRVAVTFPVKLYEEIESMSKDETTSLSQMVVRLCLEAVAARNKQ